MGTINLFNGAIPGAVKQGQIPTTNGENIPQSQEDLLRHYDEFKAKRFNPKGSSQWLELETAADDRFESLAKDPWVDHATSNSQEPTLKHNDDIKIIVFGAGIGGLMYGARLVEAGFSSRDIRLVDNAGGIGGTWYWNRYPGLMCDVDASVYAPLLEETVYIPKHKYSYGTELRQQAERIAKQYGLIGFYRCTDIKLEEDRGPNENKVELSVRSQFIVAANGFLNHPKVPDIAQRGKFKGPMFHTARWDHSVTGGTPEDPTLTGLKGKRVGIIGTGATAVQVVPQVAKWAKELQVFQRTPSSVDYRGQREIDLEEFKSKVANHKGWQFDRCESFLKWSCGLGTGEDEIKDGWTHALSYIGFMGKPHKKPIQPEEVPDHIKNLLAMDDEIAAAKRKRIAEVIRDPETARALTPWYPTWCKRPCFHDDYLPAFNLPHLHLIDTLPKGIECATENGMIVNGNEIQFDILIFCTGYRAPGLGEMEPGSTANMVYTGRDNLTMSHKWQTQGATTFHSLLCHGFPNLFLGGYAQIGNGQSATFVMDLKARHLSYIMTEAHKRAKDGDASRLTIEATRDAEEGWSMSIAEHARWWAVHFICTPGFGNNDGEDLKLPESAEEALRKARAAPHAQGLIYHKQEMENWRSDGRFQGVIVTA